MTYNANIPLPNDLLSKSQSDIKNNFTSANSTFAINHVTFDVPVDTGKHKYTEFIKLLAKPVGLAADELTLYNKLVLTQPELFMTRGAAGSEIQMSVKKAKTGDIPVAASPGATFLPGGLIMLWASPTKDKDGNDIEDDAKFLFPFGGFPNQTLNIQMTGVRDGNSGEGFWILDGSVSATGFEVRIKSVKLKQLYYVAIGI